MRSHKEIWNQSAVPVVVRNGKVGHKLKVRLPAAPDNYRWLDGIGKSSVNWQDHGSYWEMPVSWFNSFVIGALKRYGNLYIFQPYRQQSVCTKKCLEAQGFECNCLCMGEYHGSGINDGWFFVDEVFAVQWGDEMVACRLLQKGKRNGAYVCIEV
jgi:hypothetical protein